MSSFILTLLQTEPAQPTHWVYPLVAGAVISAIVAGIGAAITQLRKDKKRDEQLLVALDNRITLSEERRTNALTNLKTELAGELKIVEMRMQARSDLLEEKIVNLDRRLIPLEDDYWERPKRKDGQ